MNEIENEFNKLLTQKANKEFSLYKNYTFHEDMLMVERKQKVTCGNSLINKILEKLFGYKTVPKKILQLM